MKAGPRLSARELELLGLHEVRYPAQGGRSDASVGGACDAGACTSNDAPVRIGDAMREFLDGLRPDWQRRAPCRGAGTAQYFTERGEWVDPAWRACEGCVVAWECLGYGLEHGCVGVWGGFVLNDQNR